MTLDLQEISKHKDYIEQECKKLFNKTRSEILSFNFGDCERELTVKLKLISIETFISIFIQHFLFSHPDFMREAVVEHFKTQLDAVLKAIREEGS